MSYKDDVLAHNPDLLFVDSEGGGGEWLDETVNGFDMSMSGGAALQATGGPGDGLTHYMPFDGVDDEGSVAGNATITYAAGASVSFFGFIRIPLDWGVSGPYASVFIRGTSGYRLIRWASFADDMNANAGTGDIGNFTPPAQEEWIGFCITVQSGTTTVYMRDQNDAGFTQIATGSSDFDSETGSLVFGQRGNDTDYLEVDLAGYFQAKKILTTTEMDNLWDAATTASDSTAPTHTVDGSLTKDEILHDRFTLGFGPSEDETTADADMTYKVFTSPTNNLDTDVSTVETNGTEQNSAVGNLSELSSGDISADFDPGDTLWAVIVAYDEAGNGVIYTQVQLNLQLIFGNVDIGGVNVEGASVEIRTVDGMDLANPTAVETLATDANGDYSMATEYDRTKNYSIIHQAFNVEDSGTAESGTTTTLTDTDKAWTPDEFVDANQPYFLRVTAGTNAGYESRITDNDGDTLTLEKEAGAAFDGTSEYEIGQIYEDLDYIHAKE